MIWLKSNYRYEDGEPIVRKVSSAADFIWSDSPLEILGSVTSIAFDDEVSLPLRDHDLTTEEVIFSVIFFAIIPCILFCFLTTKQTIHLIRLNIFVMICVFWENKTSSIY